MRTKTYCGDMEYVPKQHSGIEPVDTGQKPARDATDYYSMGISAETARKAIEAIRRARAEGEEALRLRWQDQERDSPDGY